MKTLTRQAYSKRIDRVLNYLNEHMDEPLDLHRLAQEAFLSPYHFHRVYVAMMGETVADTVRRRRLHRAAMKLLASGNSLAKLAKEAGYQNTQAFARAFRDAYGVTPTQYRLHGKLSLSIAKAIQTRTKEHPMFSLKDVAIQALPATKVLAMQHKGDYQTIGMSFEKLMLWAAGKGLLAQPMRCYALYYDDPISKPKEQLLSEACLALPDNVDIAALAQGETKALTIAASRCATYLFKGPYSDLDHPYRWLYDSWLPQSGESVGQNPPYEEYLNDARSTPASELLTRICIPLNH